MTNINDNGAGGTGIFSDGNGGTTVTFPMPTQNSWTYQIITDSGAQYGVEQKQDKSTGKYLGPRLYFKFVKSKLKKHEKDVARAKLNKLKALIAATADTDQQALYELLSKELVTVVREIEAAAAGYDRFVMKADIEKFRSIVAEDSSKVAQEKAQFKKLLVQFPMLKNYPRVLPPDVKKKVDRAKSLGLFDNFHVLHLSYDDAPIKTTAQKIREKDPILFGTMAPENDKFYYVADWVDEYCDLTFDKMVAAIKTEDIGFDPSKAAEIDDDFIERLKKEVSDREGRLRDTNMGSWRGMHEKELEATKTAARKSLASRLRGWFSK